MDPIVYINLPVADLVRSRAFFEALSFSFNDRFSDSTALGMAISETCFAMLLTHDKFAQFTPKPIADASETSEVLTCLQVDSRAEVDRIVDAALANGGTDVPSGESSSFMYGRAFQDPDGHIWEVIWIDMSALPREGARDDR